MLVTAIRTVLALLLAGSLLGGCSACKTKGQDAVEYTAGHVDASAGVYESTLVDEDMLHFPPGRVYDLVHELGERPVSVQGYVSFRRQLSEDGDPFDDTRPNNVSEAAGNEMVIERWNDEVIRIRNDTCAEFFVRVVALAPTASASDEGGVGGAAGSASQ